MPVKITNNTIMLGNKYSPEFICTPFKYTLGNFIENAKNADIMIQLGGGCKYGYYFELQQKILNDLNLDVKIINLVSKGKINYLDVYKKLNNKNIIKIAYFLYLTKKMLKYMDDIENIIRINKCRETDDIEKIYYNFLKNIEDEKNIIDLKKKYKKCKKNILKNIDKNKKCIKIGIVGELYTVIEPFANHNLEKKLIERGISVIREINATDLIFGKHKKIKRNEYVNSLIGSYASDNVCKCVKLCKDKCDAILHIKSSFCTPEIGAMPIISRVCNDYNVPIIFMSFDTNLSETGLVTRIDALVDMLEMRKSNG